MLKDHNELLHNVVYMTHNSPFPYLCSESDYSLSVFVNNNNKGK